MENSVLFTEAAAEKVRSIIAEEEGSASKLRVFVQGGGCSGFTYGFTLDDVAAEDDFEVETNGVFLLVDAMSMQYLEGSTIDYQITLQAAQFIIKNPNAVSKCGCGSSFGI